MASIDVMSFLHGSDFTPLARTSLLAIRSEFWLSNVVRDFAFDATAVVAAAFFLSLFRISEMLCHSGPSQGQTGAGSRWFSETTDIIRKDVEPLIRAHNDLCFKSTFQCSVQSVPFEVRFGKLGLLPAVGTARLFKGSWVPCPGCFPFFPFSID